MKLAPLEASYFYHFYNRGNNKECIFIEEDNYSYFLKLVKKYLVPIAEIYSYCLLSNHFHLIIKIKEENELPSSIKLHQAFSNLFNAYTKAFNKKYNRTGSLFQKHPKRIKITNESYLKNLIVYVNTNPDHHSISSFPTYKFSSYKALISNQPTLIKREEVINMFNDKENFIVVHHAKKVNIKLIKELLLE
ncbi:MAG: transposase [Flavobacteriaceae bacterium]|nr:MAG: transposase [Flavobacteriaceae bacterium]